jgi:hypothetical protein
MVPPLQLPVLIVVSKSVDTYDFENVLSYNSSGFIVEFGPVGGNYSSESILASSGSFNISPNANSVATGQPAVDTATSTGGTSTPTTTGILPRNVVNGL